MRWRVHITRDERGIHDVRYTICNGGRAVGGVRKYVVIIPRTESCVPENSPRVLSMRKCGSGSDKIKMELELGGEGPCSIAAPLYYTSYPWGTGMAKSVVESVTVLPPVSSRKIF
jgi:hypothetical protein